MYGRHLTNQYKSLQPSLGATPVPANGQYVYGERNAGPGQAKVSGYIPPVHTYLGKVAPAPPAQYMRPGVSRRGISKSGSQAITPPRQNPLYVMFRG